MLSVSSRRSLVAAALVGVAFAAFPSADHSWGSYHWARKANPFTLKLGDNVSATWDGHLATASGDWTKSTVLDTVIVPGLANPKNCRPTSGRIEVCNSTYGNNGWLGLAQIWVSGSHITQAVTKLNDTYFNTPKYNTPAWRNMVMCQEIGHDFGLDHQDEAFDNPNLGTCMDYTNDPSTNQHPNQHDYDQLATIYSHLDSTTTVSQSTGSIASRGQAQGLDEAEGNTPGQWGRLVRTSNNGRTALYELDLGNGHKVFTFVIWA